ncbi:MAG: serine O-acetyltransferase EpsC [Treponema sp.]|nr:serine O-acetyltransferase EpsC [Treponema sp.]
MNIDMLIDGILDSYDRFGGINRNEKENFPNRENVINVLNELQSLIFPGFKIAEDISPSNMRFVTGRKVNNIIASLTSEIQKALVYTVCKSPDDKKNLMDTKCFKLAEQTAFALIEQIPLIREKLMLDVEAIFKGDPAAKTKEEVILSYPGLQAILTYRVANFLHKSGTPIIPRIMSEYVHSRTGIDINPGATIGDSFFIDHGTGIVIGETTIIGNNVKIYQGVTLGALSVKKELMNKKRHPTIEDDVTIYAGATILGGNTVIGKGAVIGGNTWITESVAPGTKVYC